jgi:hypothetical protein
MRYEQASIAISDLFFGTVITGCDDRPVLFDLLNNIVDHFEYYS